MKKEVSIAIVIGLLIGLIITLGISTANKALNQQKTKQTDSTGSAVQFDGTNSHQQKYLSITSHEPFDLINQSEITLSGIAWPDAVVALISENYTQITQADKDGVFAFKFNLIKGYNEISIIATDESQTSQTQNLVLTYSTSKIEL
ncbi:MAG: hypothetical protein V1810_03320 [Candidatus Beckwithbacteria bacterium]